MLGSPINLSSPVHTPSSANRIFASPVVGEFKGWFSNLFGWKNSSYNSGLLYSPFDLQTTQLSVVRLLEGLGVLVTDTRSPTRHSALLDNSTVLYCRIDQPSIDSSSGTPLKAVRFKVEIRGTGFMNEPQTAMSPIGEDNPYFISELPAAGVLSVSSPVTPINPLSAGGGTPSMISSSRPRNTLLLGGRSSSYGTPLPSPGLPGSARWDSTLPTGCLCSVALVHEKGSTSTFRLIWKKVKEECSGAYGAYPCFSPAIPNTPHEGHRSLLV
ncbi:hypothetical protein CPB83DRAFT_568944 [Crepidotus variabilis]|uniref:Uncharacterized protein n=1 Tax=Crepidotus variabilis TaxID=179855 RepID=A0A9P6JLX3_9AGAR|nr:hypothetical protein CPB83DRAFT_568944 [Crepidotus variabilis]